MKSTAGSRQLTVSGEEKRKREKRKAYTEIAEGLAEGNGEYGENDGRKGVENGGGIYGLACYYSRTASEGGPYKCDERGPKSNTRDAEQG